MILITDYNTVLQAIYAHVGFTEDWVVYPILDNTKYFWSINGDHVTYAKTIEGMESEEGDYYTGSIHHQEFYEKHVYEGKDLTMVFLDTHTDDMKYFALFKNSKKYKIKDYEG